MNRGVITISESGTVSMPTDTVWMTMQEIADMYNVFGFLAQAGRQVGRQAGRQSAEGEAALVEREAGGCGDFWRGLVTGDLSALISSL